MGDFFEMECVECKRRNYTSTKNKRSSSGRLERKKFCSSCRKHTVHRERK